MKEFRCCFKKISFFLVMIYVFTLFISISVFSQQAQLTIDNRTKASLYVKIMEGLSRKAQVLERCEVEPKSKKVIAIPRTGVYFLKVQLVFSQGGNSDTLYLQSRNMQFISDPKKGYSQYEYKLKMTKRKSQASSSFISREDFQLDN